MKKEVYHKIDSYLIELKNALQNNKETIGYTNFQNIFQIVIVRV